MQKGILVVDDDLHSREGLRDTLLGEGYRVETSADTWQAIRKIKEGVFDIAIIDLDLPAVHGVAVTAWDLARIFRAYHPAISIIVVGAEEERTVRAQAERWRVSEFLLKPISPSKLKAIVRSLNPLPRECPANTDSSCSGYSSRISPRRGTGISPLVGYRGQE
jgi:DNA-binding response OmpR family regulator